MSGNDFEQEARRVAALWAFIRQIVTVDKSDYAVKLRLHVDKECFVQVYANTHKELFSYTLVLNRARIYGRDCDGGIWHRHPLHAPDTHDFSIQGREAVSLAHFLAEAQQILQDRLIL